MKKRLETVTLLGIDCVDLDRLIQAADICQKYFDFADVKLLSSIPSDDPRVIPIEPLNTIEDYSQFTIAETDKYVDTPHVIIIQHDGFILNPDAWSEDFLKYDYIGAPWLVREVSVKRFGFPESMLGQYVVGNGGFCLRSKKLLSLCSKLSEEGFFKKYDPEDLVICLDNREYFEQHGILFAPVPLAKQFSFESEDSENYIWDGQFGFHGLKWTDISKWLEKNPGYNIDNTLNKDKRKRGEI